MRYRHFVKEHSSMLIFLGFFLLIVLIIFVAGNYSSFAL